MIWYLRKNDIQRILFYRRNTYVGLDKLDQKIIQLLIENARISYSDIGEEIGISRVAVKARIQAQVTNLLYQNDIVTQIYRVTGRDRLHVHAVASSSDEMELFLHNVIDPLPGIVSCSCNTILSRIKDIKGLRL